MKTTDSQDELEKVSEIFGIAIKPSKREVRRKIVEAGDVLFQLQAIRSSIEELKKVVESSEIPTLIEELKMRIEISEIIRPSESGMVHKDDRQKSILEISLFEPIIEGLRKLKDDRYEGKYISAKELAGFISEEYWKDVCEPLLLRLAPAAGLGVSETGAEIFLGPDSES